MLAGGDTAHSYQERPAHQLQGTWSSSLRMAGVCVWRGWSGARVEGFAQGACLASLGVACVAKTPLAPRAQGGDSFGLPKSLHGVGKEQTLVECTYE